MLHAGADMKSLAFDEAAGDGLRYENEDMLSAPKNMGSIESGRENRAVHARDNSEGNTGRADGVNEDEDDGDAHTIIAVSISRAQSVLASPRTPAAEKAAALEDIEGGGFFDSYEAHDHAISQDSIVERPPPNRKTNVISDMPTLRKSSSKSSLKTLKEEPASATISQRTRGSSISSFAENLNFKKLVTFSVPSLPKVSSITQFLPSQLNFTNSPLSEEPQENTSRRRATTSYPKRDWGPDDLKIDGSSDTRKDNYGNQPRRKNSLPNLKAHDAPPVPPIPKQFQSPKLRHSASDESLRLSRTLSRVSSLGDDARFNTIQAQVNSRFKAIKDSFADSSLRFANMKTANASTKRRFPVELPANVEESQRGAPVSRSVVRETAPRSLSTVLSDNSQSTLLETAMENLTGDVVVLGGYRGSILRSSKPPHRQLWAPVKVGLNLRKVDLEVGLNPEDEERMEDTIYSSGMLTHIGPVDISRRLLKRLRHCKNARQGLLRIHDYGYDWRLSPHLLSRKLREFLASLPCNSKSHTDGRRGAIVIAHSLGGLITRHAVNQQPELFRGLLYAGVPQSCVNILGPLRNGDDVLLSSKVLTAQVNFTLRTSYLLLPENGECFIDKHTNQRYNVDFFDIDSWIEHHLSPCILPSLPPRDNPNAGLGGLIESVSSTFSLSTLSLSQKKSSTTSLDCNTSHSPSTNSPVRETHTRSEEPGPTHHLSSAADRLADTINVVTDNSDSTLAPQMASSPTGGLFSNPSPTTPANSAIVCTIPLTLALPYLERTLAETKRFKQELRFQPHLASPPGGGPSCYPPIAVLYGKSVPTVRGARVVGRHAIRHTTAYDDLVFGSGDGVVLAKEAMVPAGYTVARGGRVSSDRGHVTLLGDLEAVGQCLLALMRAES